MKVSQVITLATVAMLSAVVTRPVIAQSQGLFDSTGTIVAACAAKKNPCASKANPCAAKKNPCASKANPCAAKKNPCAAKKNPCAAKKNPCASKANPCASKANPCAAKKNPCASKANPCAGKKAFRSPDIYSKDGLAIEGADTVAYFTQGKAVKGSARYQYQWKGATWQFSSNLNRLLFAQNPEKYAPQYGGYCAQAVSEGGLAKTDPEAWKIVDGKLYLNYDKTVQAQWLQDVPGNIQRADRNWPNALNQKFHT